MIANSKIGRPIDLLPSQKREEGRKESSIIIIPDRVPNCDLSLMITHDHSHNPEILAFPIASQIATSQFMAVAASTVISFQQDFNVFLNVSKEESRRHISAIFCVNSHETRSFALRCQKAFTLSSEPSTNSTVETALYPCHQDLRYPPHSKGI
jgi:hypothetical protein